MSPVFYSLYTNIVVKFKCSLPETKYPSVLAAASANSVPLECLVYRTPALLESVLYQKVTLIYLLIYASCIV